MSQSPSIATLSGNTGISDNTSSNNPMESTIVAWSSAILVLINSLSKEKFITDVERTYLKKQVFSVNRDLLLGFKRYLVDNQISELVKAINHVLEPVRLQQLHADVGAEVEAEVQSQNNVEFQALARLRAQAEAEAQYQAQLDADAEAQAQAQIQAKVTTQKVSKSKIETEANARTVSPDDVQVSFANESNTGVNEDEEDNYDNDDIYNDADAPPPPPVEESTSTPLKWPLGAKSSLQLDETELEHVQSVLQLLGLHHVSPASILIVFRKLDLLDELPRGAIGIVADKISRKISRMVRLATSRLPGVTDDDEENSEDEDDAADTYDPEREARDDARETQSETIMRKLRYLLIADILYIAFDLVNLENSDSVGATQLIAALSMFTASDPSEITRFIGDLLAVETAAEKHAQDTNYSEVDGISIQLVIRFLYCAASLIEAMLMLPRPDSPQFTTKLVAFFKEPTLRPETRKRSVNNVSRCARFLFGNRQDVTQCNIEDEVSPEAFAQWPQSPMALFSQMFVLPSLIKLKSASGAGVQPTDAQASSPSQTEGVNQAFDQEEEQEEVAIDRDDKTSSEDDDVDAMKSSSYANSYGVDEEDDYDEDFSGDADQTPLNPEELMERLAHMQKLMALMKQYAGDAGIDGLDDEEDTENPEEMDLVAHLNQQSRQAQPQPQVQVQAQSPQRPSTSAAYTKQSPKVKSPQKPSRSDDMDMESVD